MSYDYSDYAEARAEERAERRRGDWSDPAEADEAADRYYDRREP